MRWGVVGQNGQVRTTPDAITLADGEQLDAFHRLRTSNPFTLFYTTFNYNNEPLLFNEGTSGTGTVTHDTNEVAMVLSTGGTASGASATFQSKEYVPYEPGTSMQWTFSATMGAQVSACRKYIGPHGSSNGIYFSMDGTNLIWGQRSKTSGSVVDTEVTQSNWNGDKLDGTGASGHTLDMTKDYLFQIDYEWPVGRARCAIDVGGEIGFVVAHTFDNSGAASVPYMQSGTLPIRGHIENTGTAGGTGSFKFYEVSAASEGGFRPHGLPYSAGTGVTTTSVSGTEIPIVSIKPRTTFGGISFRGFAELVGMSIYNDDVPILWRIRENPTTLTGASFADVDTTNSIMQIDTTASAVGGGVVLDQGYLTGGAAQKQAGTVQGTFNDRLVLSTNLDATDADVITLTAQSLSTATDVAASLTWEEVY